jgi:lysophospholipase L1-like esterase
MDTIRYLALGDSIATGTLTFWVKTKSYAHYLYDLIKKNEPTANIQYTNLAADGDTSMMFLYKLNHWPYLQQKIKKADIITLSIGGNDIMRGANIPGFCRINWPLVKSSSLSFCSNWEKIIGRLRELNPHCRIIVNTLYNPYNGKTSSLRPWQRNGHKDFMKRSKIHRSH